MKRGRTWTGTKALVTGGAGFIGGHLVDRLVKRGAVITIVDNFSKGNDRHVRHVFAQHGIALSPLTNDIIGAGPHRLMVRDLTDPDQVAEVVRGQEVIFHLAATVGGRGYIEGHPADCCGNMTTTEALMRQALRAGVAHVHYASSACIYPVALQARYDSGYLLKEVDAFTDGWANCDKEYGWAKFMGEMILQAYHRQYGLKGSVCRYVTVYGPWEDDSHAIIALIKRAVEKEDPYVIWGSGEQDRDFTYVDDIVEGSIRAAETIEDGAPINLGTSRRYKIKDVAEMIFALLGWRPQTVRFDSTKPEGVASRALDISRARELLGWEPQVELIAGLRRTIQWFMDVQPLAAPLLTSAWRAGTP